MIITISITQHTKQKPHVHVASFIGVWNVYG